MPAIIPRVTGLCYGGDYNPEQWPEDVWVEDVALMREAGVTLATVGVFSWAWLQPAPDRWEFGWLDRVLDLLHAGGIAVDLATATASPPPWFSTAFPASLPVTADGRVLHHGSRQAYCPSSPDYRAAALTLVERLAGRYGDHPALALWHLNNEFACHVPACFCDTSAEAFRGWLRERYGTVEALNDAWGTAFWSQRYDDWSEIIPPRATPAQHNPAQALDFRRFSSAEVLSLCVAERDLLTRLTPGVPVTTNLMPTFTGLDHWAWAPELRGEGRLVSTDHYVMGDHPASPAAQIAFAADVSRSLAAGPWLLMEHSTSAVNWQPRNFAKPPGRLVRDALGHVARGSEGAMYFQWRASVSGGERWHSGMVPHAGTDSRIWREVVELGRHLRALADVDGATVAAPVAILLDYESHWAQEQGSQPSADMTCFDEIARWHRALWRAGIAADVAHPEADLSRYPVLLAPALYALSDAGAANLTGRVAAGAHLLVGPYSGVVDEHDRVRTGGYPGALRDLLGVRIEEFYPLPAGATVALTDGAHGHVWSELGRANDARVLAAFAEGPVAGSPALTRRRHGAGTAWYVGTRLSDGFLGELLADVTAGAGVTPTLPGTPPAVEAVRRSHPDGTSFLFLLNHGDEPATVPAAGEDLLTGGVWAGPTQVPAGGVVVLREAAAAAPLSQVPAQARPAAVEAA
ncbi:beta-galactosidase [Luedemannella flava]|uniref:beta-galactosidase n=1 Tax=Luedemannella flava TaxID=349316 RepID=UPI0031D634DD